MPQTIFFSGSHFLHLTYKKVDFVTHIKWGVAREVTELSMGPKEFFSG